MSIDKKKIATAMRKFAETLREEAEQRQKEYTEKCAQILVAARGLGTLQQLLKGVTREL